jgi:ABC-type phosphate transport system permease subunit
MTEEFFLLLLEHSVWFCGEYDICFPVGVLAAIYMSEYVKMAGLKKLLSK